MTMNIQLISAPSEATKVGRVLTFVAIACILLTAACVSSGTYDVALQERDELAEQKRIEQEQCRREKEALEAELANRRAEIAALGAEKGRMKGEIGQLEGEMQDLGGELDRQKGELVAQQQKAARLKSTYDGLMSNLKNELASGQIEIRQLRDGLSVDVAQEILFASGSAKLDKTGQEVLRRVSAQLKKTQYEIVVGGHTDNVKIGPGLVERYPSNWELAAARASAVVRLFEDSGIDVKRLRAVSFGEYHPRDTNETREGRERNRRIEIRLRPVVPEEDQAG
jgi:chemotaxis protein MotB